MDRYRRSWLSDERACVAMDQALAGLLGGHLGLRGRSATPEQVLPWSCQTTGQRLADWGPTPKYALECTTVLVQLGELLLCAESGGHLRRDVVERFAGGDRDRYVAAEALRRLRNVCCHPGALSPEHGDVALYALIDYAESHYRDEDWLADVRGAPARLRDRRVTLFALRLVDLVGSWQAQRWGIALRDVQRRR